MLKLRQGDVPLREIKSVPAKAKNAAVKKSADGKTVLALGEVTGHHHRFGSPDVQMFRDEGPGGFSIIEVLAPSDLVHEEHTQIGFPVGVYEQLRQVEYVPRALPRNVAD